MQPLSTPGNDTEVGPAGKNYPEYDKVPAGGIRVNPSVYRLRWTLNGPITTAISVLPANSQLEPSYYQNLLSGDDSEPYYQPPTTTTGTTQSDVSESESESRWPWHSVSHESLTFPPISLMTVECDRVKDLEYEWLELHQTHSCPPESAEYIAQHAEEEDLDADGRDGDGDGCGAVYDSVLPDDHFDDDDELTDRYPGIAYDADGDNVDWEECDGPGTGHLIACCGSKRPRRRDRTSRIRVSVETAAGGYCYLTLHDLVEQLHPWLMMPTKRRDILRAKAVQKMQLLDQFGSDERTAECDDRLLFVNVWIGSSRPSVDVLDEDEVKEHAARARAEEEQKRKQQQIQLSRTL